MSRAIVLIVCLTAAGAVAAYTHYSQTVGEPTPVFTVHAPDRNTAPAAPVPRPVQPSQRANPIPGDRASLVRELQRELKRVGCYSGDVNGVWTTSSRMAMKSVTDRVNATLPIDNPDDVLLSSYAASRTGPAVRPAHRGRPQMTMAAAYRALYWPRDRPMCRRRKPKQSRRSTNPA